MGKVLLICRWFPPLVGGIENYLYEIYSRLPIEDIQIVAPFENGCEDFDCLQTFKILRARWPIRLSSSGKLVILPLLTKSFRVLQKSIFTQIHCGHISTGFIGYIANKLLKIPYIVYTYGLDVTSGNPMWLKKLILREAAVVITISNYTKKVLLKLGVDPSKIVIVSPGVNPNRFNPSINPIKVVKKHSIKGKKVILTVGRLAGQERYKGQDMVIRAMPKIVAQLPDTIYILVGDGEDRPRLKKLVQELKLEDIVIFAGQVSNEELPSYYSACDAFVMCSREIQNEYRQKKTEGFGIVFLEASACGKPVIGGRSGGIEDAVIDGETGILVDPNNIDEIAETVIKLLTGDTLAQRLGRQGRDRVVNELSWDKVAAKIGEVVHNLR